MVFPARGTNPAPLLLQLCSNPVPEAGRDGVDFFGAFRRGKWNWRGLRCANDPGDQRGLRERGEAGPCAWNAGLSQHSGCQAGAGMITACHERSFVGALDV